MNTLGNFVIIGGIGVGKTTLFNALLQRKQDAMKTQALMFHDEQTIDTPGEYFENPRLYTALISTMSTIDTVLYVHQSNSVERKIPPGLFGIYDHKMIGVISKIDLPDARIEEVREILREYGIGNIMFEVSIYYQQSIDRLREYLRH